MAALYWAALLAAAAGRLVPTEHGAVRGRPAPAPPHSAFLGVPYARPPTHHHRFKAPDPPQPWDGIYEATHRVRCLQAGGGDENCLVLNVFAPDGPPRRPVLVLLHGGGFQRGWGGHQAPARLLARFVVVTVNYRLGALGFLCLGTPAAPGNAGLKDQVAALYWIQRNIANFGGNPSDVTVYGVGAGAAALQLLLLSNLTEGLLHKVILESGSALSPLSMTYDPVAVALAAAAELGYGGGEDLDELATFFEQLSTNQISKVDKMFLPCVDTNNSITMFDKDPFSIFKTQKYHKVPMIVVYTNKVLVTGLQQEVPSSVPGNFEHLLPSNLQFPAEDVKDKIAEFVRGFYFNEEDSQTDVLKHYIDYLNDVTMEYPIMRSAAYHASGSSVPVYLMKFNYISDSERSEFKSADYSLLNYFYAKNDLSQNDELVAQRLLALWSNFINIGDPTPLTSTLIPMMWPPVQTDHLQQAQVTELAGLGFGNTMVTQKLTTQSIVFWDNIYKTFYRKCTSS